MSQKSRATTRLIAIAGAKGGVGRTTCAIALGRSLVIRERRVLLVDLSALACGMSTLLDMETQAVQPTTTFEPVHTPLQGLDLVCLAPHDDELPALCDRLRHLGYDDVVLDLRGGFGYETYELFLHADLPILISNPEPTCLNMTMLWLRYVIANYVQNRQPEFATYFADCADRWHFVEIYTKMPPKHQNRLIQILKDFKCTFILNNRREQSESLQCTALCHALGMTLGIEISPLGTLSSDDRRWFYERRMADVSLFVREDLIVRELEAMFRENLPTFDKSVCLPTLDAQNNPREFLRVQAPSEARSAYRQLWEGYKRENGLVSAVMPRQMIGHTIQLLEIARRFAEIESSTPHEDPQNSSSNMSHVSQHKMDAVRQCSGSMTRVGGKLTPKDCNIDAGQWLKEQRLQKGLSIAQLAMKTRIPTRLLEHIESLSFEPMAAARFLAYLFEIARGLDIPNEDVKNHFGL